MTIPGIPFSIPMNPSPRRGSVIPIQVFRREPLITDVKYPIGFVVLIGENPLTGSEGDLWYLSYFNSSGQAIWKKFASDPDGIESVTTDDGAPPVEPDSNGNISIIGGRAISTTGQSPGSTVTINFTGSGVDTWTVITDSTLDMVANNGYFANNGAGVIFTLPATAAVGDTFVVNAMNAGGWSIHQLSGQTIHFFATNSTTGVTGSVSSTKIGDTITLVCSVADTDFTAISAPGNIDVV